MLAFLVKHSLIGMFVCALLGFAFPVASNTLFPFLPYVLFTLMLLTLVGMPMEQLVKRLCHGALWLYALWHSAVYMLVFSVAGWLLGVSDALLLAILGVAATGSLFATPAIVRALGFDALEAMAMTIATTLLLPLALYIPIHFLPMSQGSLDFVTYGLRLLIFIVGPILISFSLHKLVPKERLQRALLKISPYTILLVFAFPFGLIGSYRNLFDQSVTQALVYLLIAVLLVALFFCGTFLCYRKQGVQEALTAAITSGNRNVLLTYSIAGALLGPAFLPLAGAMQVPTYILPVVTRRLAHYLSKTP
ncbi:hypothetical protein MAQ5080_00053 [Marinomonas aquimarina]|uniref:Sodium Bile acid symporter family protein n=1 Tax=Marinomonas aquimarina TaxID=295068 RepID=A0A1A8SZK5_9GAMM|nr:hypothetical protein [Marinomonas aquimarina]SBS24630.1 hypothetical protein MAQ5080_00053 [Marinomonas aquimarina]